MKQEIALGPFLPDAPDYANPGLIRCDNVFAAATHYKPIPSIVGAGTTIPGEIRGAFRFELPDGNQVFVVGTTSDLYVIRGGSVTPSGLGVSLERGEFWSFDQDRGAIYASTKRTGFYRLPSIFTDTVFVAPLGNPPKASTINVVGEFLVAGDLEDIDTSDQPYRVRWGAYGDPNADWVTDISRQSGFVDMPTRFGRVTAIYGGAFDLIFQAQGVSRIWYSGGPSVFSKDEIEEERGCVAPTSIVRVGAALYFLSHDGFCRSDGTSVELVSSEVVWDWFIDQRDTAAQEDVQGVVDFSRRSIIWSFAARSEVDNGIGGVTSYRRRQLIYNWALDRWTTGSFSADWLVQSNVKAATIDTDEPSIPDDADLDIGGSFDDPINQSRGRELAAFVNGEIGYFTGGNMQATFETGDFQPQPGQRSLVSAITPLVEAPARQVLAQVGSRPFLGVQKRYSARKAQGPLGFCPIVSDGLYQSVRLTIPSGAEWQKASGFIVDWQPTGEA